MKKMGVGFSGVGDGRRQDVVNVVGRRRSWSKTKFGTRACEVERKERQRFGSRGREVWELLD